MDESTFRQYPWVCDVSNNDLDAFDFDCMKAQGVVGIIPSPFSRFHPPHDMARFADEALRHDMPIISWYGLPYFGDTAAEERDLKWCVELARDYPPLTKALVADVETDACDNGWNAPRPTADQRVDALWRIKRDVIEAAGYKCIVYAGIYYWANQMGNTKAFEDCDWILPTYGIGGLPCPPITLENIDPGHILSFKPKLIGHQFTSLWGQYPGKPCGRPGGNRDMIYWYGDLEMGMTADEKKLMKIAGGSYDQMAIWYD